MAGNEVNLQHRWLRSTHSCGMEEVLSVLLMAQHLAPSKRHSLGQLSQSPQG